LTQKASGIESVEAQTLRAEVDEVWDTIRSGLTNTGRVESIDAELARMQTRAEVVADRLTEITKEADEMKAELELIAKRTIVFKGKRAQAQALVDGETPSTVSPELAASQNQITNLQATLATLMQVLATQAPTVIQSMPPSMLANLTGPTTGAAQGAPPQLAAPVAISQAVVPSVQAAALPVASLHPGPGLQPAQGGGLAQAVARTPTPTRASSTASVALAGAGVARGTARKAAIVGAKTLGVRKAAIKDAAVRQRVPADDDEELNDSDVQAQLLAYHQAAASRAAAAEALQAPVVDATLSVSEMPMGEDSDGLPELAEEAAPCQHPQ